MTDARLTADRDALAKLLDPEAFAEANRDPLKNFDQDKAREFADRIFAKVYAGAILKVIPAEWWGTRAMDGAHLGNYLAEYVEELRAASLPSSPTPIRCPICDGRGVVAYPPNTVAGQGWSSSSTGNYSCPLCKGALIVQPSALPSRPTAPPLQNSPALQRAFDRLTKLATATGSGPVTIDHTDVSDLAMILGAIAAYGLKDPDNAALPASAEHPK